MTTNRKPTGRATSIPAGIAWGTVTSVAITILGAMVTAKLIEGEVLQWMDAGYGALVILLLASWAGAVAGASKIKRQRLMVSLAVGIAYFMTLVLAVAVFFGGGYSGIGETGLLIFCGSILGALQGHGRKSVRKQLKTGRYCR